MDSQFILSGISYQMFQRIKTGNIFLDIIIGMMISSLIAGLVGFSLKSKIESCWKCSTNMCSKKTNSIEFISSQDKHSDRYKAVLFYISKNPNPTIKSLLEVYNSKYNWDSESYEKNHFYRVDQRNKFKITDDIHGEIYVEEKETSVSDKTTNKFDEIHLEIHSEKLSLLELQTWIEGCIALHRKEMIARALEHQYAIECTWDAKESKFDFQKRKWESSTMFDNKFFDNKKEILAQIDFFLNNKQWYQDKGIAYQMGIMIYGPPGCGKTSFVKALMNLTGWHLLDIKLHDRVKLSVLKELMYSEDIDGDLIIPHNKRLLFFEDIDGMGDIVKDRDLIEEESKKEKEVFSKMVKKMCVPPPNPIMGSATLDSCSAMLDISNNDNNLSYFLNILDGFQECPGRIIIMTTNKPEFLDKAILRPGRIDIMIKFDNASLENIKDVLNHYWGSDIDISSIPESLNRKKSHAVIVNTCRKATNVDETLILLKKMKIE